MKSIEYLFPRVTYKEVESALIAKGWKIRRISRENPYGGYVSGFLVADEHANECRWGNLQDLKINCIDDRRNIDGFMRKHENLES